MWQSSNEGYTWSQIFPNENFVAMYFNNYWDDRAWLVTNTETMYMTTDAGKTWIKIKAPTPPNMLGINSLSFHPQQTDWLLFTGSVDCAGHGGNNCRSVAYYSKDHGRRWHKFEEYVRQCTWARDKKIKIDERQILCESYRDKKGNQKQFPGIVPMEFVLGRDFYSSKEVLFKNVVGFARFSEYILVAEVCSSDAP